MRWKRLFEDLGSQQRAEDDAVLEADVASLLEARTRERSLTEALAGQKGAVVVCLFGSGLSVQGEIGAVGEGWFCLEERAPEARQWICRVGALTSVKIFRPGYASADGGVLKLTLSSALRALQTHRISLWSMGGSGPLNRAVILERIGRDFLRIRASDEQMDGARELIPVHSLEALSSLI